MTQHLLRPARHRAAAGAAALATTLVLAASSATAAPLDDIRRQVEASQFEPAYQTGQANPQLIGDPHFDFLFGVAAVNVGRVPEGLLALERHLAAVPANDRARLELARGYFLLGDYARARSEFEFVLRYNPPSGVRANIAGFLQAMQVREVSEGGSSSAAYIELGAGYDSNVNVGTYRDEVDLGFGPVSLVGSPSKQISDSFGHLAVGGQKTLRVSNRLSVFAGADLDHKGNARHADYNLSNGTAFLGFTHLGSDALWRVTLSTTELRVGHKRYRDALALGVQASYTLGADASLVVLAQGGEIRHAASDEIRDARTVGLSATYTINFPDVAWQPQFILRPGWTLEENSHLRKDLGKQMAHIRATVAVKPEDRLRLTATLMAQQHTYGEDFALGVARKDNWLGAELGATYAIDARWTLRAEARWTRIESNLDLNDSDTKTVGLKLRYQF